MSRSRGDFSLDRLRQSQHHLTPLLRIAQEKLVVGITEIAGLEQNGGRIGAAEDMESGKAVGIGPQLDPARRLADKSRR